MVNSRAELAFLEHLHTIFASLQTEEVEQFYTAYRQWLLLERIVELRQRLTALQEQISENELRLEQYRPSPIALASLARLQASGVSDLELLDQMHERGEAWLDATMQRLDYFEQFENFLSDDYTQWCRRALEGAFDWVDTLFMAGSTPPSPQVIPTAANQETLPSAEDGGDIEAMLLQKLSSETEDDESAAEEEETTLKQAAITEPVEDNEVQGQPEPVQPAQPGQQDQPVPTPPGEQAPLPTAETETPVESVNDEAEVVEEHVPDESQSGGEGLSPPQEQLVNGANAEIAAESMQEQPTLVEVELAPPIEAAETNGAAQPANEEAALNGGAEDASPRIARAPARKKRGLVWRLIGRLLGSK